MANGYIMFLFLRHKSIRVARNYIIFSLSLADFLIGLFAMPFAADQNHLKYWNFSKSFCNFHAIMDSLGTLVSIFTVTLTALLDIRLVFGKGIKNVYSPINIGIILALSWLIPGMTLLVPISINPRQMSLFIKYIQNDSFLLMRATRNVTTTNVTTNATTTIMKATSNVTTTNVTINATTKIIIFQCLPSFPTDQFTGQVVFFFIIGLFLTIIAYTIIFFKIRSRKRAISASIVSPNLSLNSFENLVSSQILKIRKSSSNWTSEKIIKANASVRLKRNENLLRMMFAIGMLAWVCYLPSSIVFLLEANAKIPLWAYKLGIWLAYIKSTINPIIYGFMNKNFKKFICKTFRPVVEHKNRSIIFKY
ncbi:unnamed protein product [Gordionus sp. m RMFG-2023]|uniref:neuropeptide FF receptor 2-like n=1 Tax=Gordionus sp. m RMFG-2023 TaxID=3053472 RepID=UPI0030E246B4